MSIDGRVYVWKITEIPDEEPQISGKIVIAVQIVGEGESVHPRVCWHCHKQVTFYFPYSRFLFIFVDFCASAIGLTQTFTKLDILWIVGSVSGWNRKTYFEN